jgi:tetratricopeptide (TPR) repeat protein
MQTQQSITNFIGRLTEIEIFKQWFADGSTDAPKILYCYDVLEAKEKKGGVGKTWLLRQCAHIAREQYAGAVVVMIDFFDIASRDGIAIAERTVEALKDAFPRWNTTEFTEALKSYHGTASTEHLENTELRIALYRALAADLNRLEKHFIQQQTFLLVMFDTTELIERTPSIAVLNFAQLFPDNYQFERMKFVIASRNKIDWSQPNWLGREKEVREVAIEPFNQQEMIEYLLKEAIYDADMSHEQIQALYERTQGRPIMVGLVADVLNNHVVSIEELVKVAPALFEAHLVPQIQRLENPTNWVILFMAHVYHRFNGKILHWILAKSGLRDIVHDLSSEELMDRLPALSFVRTFASGDYLVLHDEMRRLVNEYCWKRQDPERSMRRDISRCMVEYLELEMHGKGKDSGRSEQEKQMFTVEMLFHAMFLDIDKGLKFFKENFSSALVLSKRAFARVLLQEALAFWDELSEVQQRDLQLLEADLLRIEEDPATALRIHQLLEENASAEWFREHEARIYWERGLCYLLQSKFAEAVESLQRSLEIERARGNEPQVGTILKNLGFTYRNQGQFDKAQEYYEQGLALYAKLANQSEYANMINNLSNIYRLRGKTQLALRYCQIGLNIRKSLFQAGKSSEYPVALSLSTMGLIYLDGGHFAWGGQKFQEAYEIHLRLGRKRELVQLYNRFGQICVAQGDYEEARNLFRRAEEAALEINTEAYINSLNKQGRLLMLQKRWSEAVPLFERAVNKAKDVHDDYQQAENLVDLAQAFYRFNASEAAEKTLQEVRNISEQWRYYDLLGQVEEFLGNINYEAQEYKMAFVHYRQYCRYMAIRSDVEYNKALALIIDNLYGTPKEETQEIVDDFIAYWSQENLDQDYPELAKTLQEIGKAKFLEYLPATDFPPLPNI